MNLPFSPPLKKGVADRPGDFKKGEVSRSETGDLNMNISPAKENILKKIRKALTQSTPLPFPGSEGTNSVFKPSTQEMEIEFGEQFTKLLGKFVYCADVAEMQSQLLTLINNNGWKNIYVRENILRELLLSVIPGLREAKNPESLSIEDLTNCDAAITSCEALVARTGSIMMSSGQQSGRTTSVYAPIHICIAYTNQLVYDVRDGLQLIKDKYGRNIPSLVTFATGPSRTADIEKTLVVGVHGPKEVYVFLIDNINPPAVSL
jgi:L-lactate dehydrogenase complex protein LldG